MAQYLTAAGIRLCLALTGNDPAYVPTPDDCSLKMMKLGVYGDRWGRSPITQPSCPDNNNNDSFCQPSDYKCIIVMTYDIYDGSKGSSRICTRDTLLKWSEDGLPYWVVPQSVK